MSRLSPWLVALTLALALPLTLTGCGGGPEVATYRVERRDFVHQITADGNLRAVKATVVGVPPSVNGSLRIAWLAPEGTVVAAGDVVARFDASEMERRLENGVTDLATSDLKITKAEVENEKRLSTIVKDREMAELELEMAERFQVEDEVVYSGFEIIESAIDKQLAGQRERHSQAMEEIQGSLAQTELDLLEIDRRRAQLDVDQAQEGLQALEVRAPHGGILTWVRDWRGEPPQVGGQVWRAQELAQIPDLDRMEAQVFVLEADAGGLAVGKRAEVTVEAHPGRVFPATVRHVDSVANPRFRGSPVQYFGVTLELETTDPEVMKPGQRVQATLLLEERPDSLVVPRQAVFETGGSSQVWVAEGDGFKARPVTVAAASLGLVAIGEGLEEGDVVALEAVTLEGVALEVGAPGRDEPAPTVPEAETSSPLSAALKAPE